jgi:predicted nucleotidyltransferase
MSTHRHQEVAALLEWAERWAGGRGDVAGLLLAGSWARGAARDDSDVDLVLLSDDPSVYDAAFLAERTALGAFVTTRGWGPLTEWRFVRESGLEIELCVGTPDWAGTSPVDAGTRRVVSDGVRPLYDPRGLIAGVIDECAG